MSGTGTVRIGISGWTYAPWRGNFYPSGLLHADELSYASRQVDTIEINGTFYGLQRPDAFARWYDETPEDFVFAVKGPRFITHIRRLREIETPLANFFASGVLRLEEKLGPVLWQFPPSFRFSAERLDHFFSLLPRDTEAAAALAEGRSEWLAERSLGQDRATARAAARDRDPPPELSRPGLRDTLAPAPGGARLRRLGGVALCRGCDRRFRLSAPARLRGALCQRLFRRGPRPLGGAHQAVGRGARTERRAPDRSRRRACPAKSPAMSMPISTTTRRSAHPVDARSLRSQAV